MAWFIEEQVWLANSQVQGKLRAPWRQSLLWMVHLDVCPAFSSAVAVGCLYSPLELTGKEPLVTHFTSTFPESSLASLQFPNLFSSRWGTPFTVFFSLARSLRSNLGLIWADRLSDLLVPFPRAYDKMEPGNSLHPIPDNVVGAHAEVMKSLCACNPLRNPWSKALVVSTVNGAVTEGRTVGWAELRSKTCNLSPVGSWNSPGPQTKDHEYHPSVMGSRVSWPQWTSEGPLLSKHGSARGYVLMFRE